MNKYVSGALLVGAGTVGGLVVANVITDGAVMGALKDIKKGKGTEEVAECVEVYDATTEMAV